MKNGINLGASENFEAMVLCFQYKRH